MNDFEPPLFDPHRLVRGGHLQTILSVSSRSLPRLNPVRHQVTVSEGDIIVLHEDCAVSWKPGDASLLLIHGLTGCHGAPYMLRLAERFVSQGMRVFRMDMRGCGAGLTLARNLTHAGRSDDVLAALDMVAQRSGSGPIAAIGVSLGANQLLRAMGRIGAGLEPEPTWFGRLRKIAAVAPPLDLQRCSENMDRWSRRPYNYYFIRALLSRAPEMVRRREEFQREVAAGRPKTLRELDDRFTAPLSGFADAAEYYARSAAKDVARHNPIPTLVLAAADDPLVPVGCFVDDPDQWPASTKVMVTQTGGHVGFIDRRGRCWMDEAMAAWFQDLT